ncbi:MAG: anhydro-N-acetylmuramic acid kinase [Bacteroidota bacterium]
MTKRTYRILGLMSGSALDGLDLAYCRFELAANRDFELLNWEIEQATTLPYSESWQNRLAQLIHADARSFAETHVHYARYVGQLVNQFLADYQLDPDYIASHGHTIFHFPDLFYTTQIGEGAALAATTGYPVICDFRTQDVAQGGQGAPIASIADKYFFGQYDFCLNLGGIANLTAKVDKKYVAFDISGANQILNALAAEIGLAYDDKGELAAQGNLIPTLFKASNQLDFLTADYPKTLDNQWVKTQLLPIFKNPSYALKDRLHTAVQHIAYQIAAAVKKVVEQEAMRKSSYHFLATGGGAYNNFLMTSMQRAFAQHTPVHIHVPSDTIISFKEAAMIALMGVMRIENVPNCMSNVTGAKFDTINGAIYQGWKKLKFSS